MSAAPHECRCYFPGCSSLDSLDDMGKLLGSSIVIQSELAKENHHLRAEVKRLKEREAVLNQALELAGRQATSPDAYRPDAYRRGYPWD